MAWRIQETDVQDVIGVNTSIPLRPFIVEANSLTDEVAANDTASKLSAARLALIEANLAAWSYGIRDRQYASNTTDGASAKYDGETDKGFDANHWGQKAKLLDTTGYLSRLDKGVEIASATWLGKPPSEQTPYTDRD